MPDGIPRLYQAFGPQPRRRQGSGRKIPFLREKAMTVSEEVRIPVGADTLAGTVCGAGAGREDVVIYVHGLGSTRYGEKSAAVADACLRVGHAFAAFDFRGHGESGGRLVDLRGSTLQEDLDAAADFLATRGFRRLWLVGSSMGAWASAWFAVRRPERVGACVLVAPAFDFPWRRWQQLDETARDEWRRTGKLRLRNEWVDLELGYGLVEEADRFPLDGLAAEWDRPLLVFHGMRDDVVPFSLGVDLAGRIVRREVEVRLFSQGDHRLNRHKETLAEEALSFFRRHGLDGTRFPSSGGSGSVDLHNNIIEDDRPERG